MLTLLLSLIAPPVYAPPSYEQGVALAGKSTPLVVYVGCQPRPVTGAVVCRTHYLPGYPAQCVVVALGGNWKATLPMTATVVDVRKEVERIAPTFRPILAVQPTRADCQT